MNYIAFDCHRRYTFARVEDASGRRLWEGRIPHRRGIFLEFLEGFEPSTPRALETIGSWYWVVDEIEARGLRPRLVHARGAKVMMGMIDKSDKLDAKGLNILQRTGTLPEVWIPSGEIRDRRELPRSRMLLVRQRRRLKQRVLSNLAKYGFVVSEVSDPFGRKGREILKRMIAELPPETRRITLMLLEEIEHLEGRIEEIEGRMREVFSSSEEVELLQSIPGVGFILAVVIALEVGDISRFGGPERFVSYCGLVPRVEQSGSRVRYGRMRKEANRYLKWAFIEAANAVALNARRWPERHASRLPQRIKQRKGHGKAVGAVGRHLAEAAYWILRKGEPYRDPGLRALGARGA